MATVIWRKPRELAVGGSGDQEPVQQMILSGDLEQPLRSLNWLQTAEVIDGLDVVVSVDTSAAHLAGALGSQLMRLSCPADWRWGQSGERTFLYDSFFGSLLQAWGME